MALNRSTVLARLPSLVVVGMITVALVGAVAGRIVGPTSEPEHGQAIAARDLRFEDRADGAVLIYDGRATTPFEVVQGENGFLRGTLRGLARTRRSEGLDSSQPFHLAAWSDGRLTLDDPATGRHIELEAFGHTNADVFAHLLPGLDRAPVGGA
jgi:putative photosynthetic complex assembly protein